MSRASALRAGMLAAIALVALGAITAPKARTAVLPFAAGETLEYAARWQRMEAASARLVVAQGPREGTFRVTADARTSAMVASFLRMNFNSEIECDASTLLPIRVLRVTGEGDQKRVEEAIFDHRRGELKLGGRRLPLEAEAHDPLSLLYGIRAMRFGRLGSTRRIPLTDLGQPLDLDIEVLDRKDGVVTLRLTSIERSEPRQRAEYRLRMEEGGRRRILNLSTALPFGEVELDLKR